MPNPFRNGRREKSIALHPQQCRVTFVYTRTQAPTPKSAVGSRPRETTLVQYGNIAQLRKRSRIPQNTGHFLGIAFCRPELWRKLRAHSDVQSPLRRRDSGNMSDWRACLNGLA